MFTERASADFLAPVMLNPNPPLLSTYLQTSAYSGLRILNTLGAYAESITAVVPE
jgi:hypothetical protein